MSVFIIFYVSSIHLAIVFQDFISEAHVGGRDFTDHLTYTDGTLTMHLSPANTV